MKKKATMLKKHILKKTYFIPMEKMRKVIQVAEEDKNPFFKKKSLCEKNLFLLQRTRLNTFDYSTFGKANWMIMFSLACHKALYAHDWDRLLYLLKKVPKWKLNSGQNYHIYEYIYSRYLTLLLMYHKSSQAQGLLCEYLHMTWGCRSDQDKKALQKVLLDMPKKMPQPLWNKHQKKNDEDSE